MRAKLYLIAICASIFCASTVYGENKCPTIPEHWDGKSDLNGWSFIYNKDPQVPATEWIFLNAWIYDAGGDNAKCHYTHPGKSGARLSFQKSNGEINSSNHHFEGVERNQKHPGYHCKGNVPENCIFRDGPAMPGK